MAWPLGTGAVQTRLKQVLGIRGNIPLELDETITPVVNVLDFEPGPVSYPLYGSAFRNDVALAGNFSHVGIRPGLGTVLVVDEVFVMNIDAAVRTMVIGITTSQAPDATQRVISINQPPSAAALGLRFLAAEAFDQTQAGTMVSTTDGAVLVPANTAVLVPGKWVLHTTQEGARMALVVRCVDVNIEARAWFRCREYDVP